MREINDTLWLGKLPNTWNTVELGQVYEERKVKVKETIYEPLSVTMKGIVPQLASAVKAAEESDRKLVKAGDFVINSRSDRKGACGVSEKDGSCSVINIVIRPRNLQTAEYYNYALLSVYFPEEFYRWGHGIASDLWTTRWSEMRKIKLPNPPDSVKEKIVFHIKNKCNEIAKLEKDTRRIIEDYKILKNSYIEDLVVHGVRKCESWKKSDERGFGNIPSHWHMLKIKRIFNIRKEIAGREGLQLLSITQKGIVPKDISRNEGQTAADYSKYQIVHVDDYAMNHMDLRTGWVDLSNYEGVTSPDYRVFYINNEMRFNKDYYKYVMQYCYIKELFYSAAQGINENGRYRLKTDSFLNFRLMVPPIEEQIEIAQKLNEKIGAINEILESKEQFLENLIAYKRIMYYEYVTGKKEVPES